MVKHRFSTHDVAAEVGCLKQQFLGMRLANIYDINAKVGYIQEDINILIILLKIFTAFFHSNSCICQHSNSDMLLPHRLHAPAN